MIWFMPVLILIMGANPSVASSIWWKVLGILLFAGIVVVCIYSWYQVHREQREEEKKRFDYESVVYRQFY
jgi:membrane protein implicated in regulation of membrane protease activity